MVDLELSGLRRSYPAPGGTVDAVRSFDLSVRAGEFVAILGPSGCGKSTLLRLVAGLEEPDAGRILFAGAGSGKGPRIGHMFQDARLLPWLTVEENLLLAFPRRTPCAGEEIGKVLELVGLESWRKAYPRQLSGGMAQRVALARALCRKPEILLLDEPFGALDAITRTRLRGELDALWRRLRITVILVTHDIEEAACLADRVAIMKKGSAEGEFPLTLDRPRDRRDPALQSFCRAVERALDLERMPSARGSLRERRIAADPAMRL